MLCFFGWTLRLRSEKKLFGTNGKESTETILLVWWWEASESLGLKNKQLLETHLIAATLRDMEGSSLTCWNETQCYWRREVAATWRLTLFFFRGVFTTERKRIDSMDPLSLKRLRRVWEKTKKVASLWTSTLYCPINTAIIAQQAICTSPERSWKEPQYRQTVVFSRCHINTC